jgi:hypothetical protein
MLRMLWQSLGEVSGNSKQNQCSWCTLEMTTSSRCLCSVNSWHIAEPVKWVLDLIGGLVVIVLAIGPKVRESKPGRGQWTKIRSRTSFGGEVNPAVPYRKILRHVKEPYFMQETLVGNFLGHFRQVSSCFATRLLCWLLTENCGGYIKND